MTRVIGYIWNADTHSIEDTKQAAECGQLVVNNDHPLTYSPSTSQDGNLDEHGLHYNLCDMEGNRISPVFDTDAWIFNPYDGHQENDMQALRLQIAEQTRIEWGESLYPKHEH
jgi:hypothetical protein